MAIWRTVVRHDSPTVGSPGYNTFHLRTDGEAPPEDRAGEVLQELFSDLAGEMPPASSFVSDGVWIDVERKVAAQTPEWTETGSLNGVSYGASGLCLIFSWRTEIRSRSGRGRTFFGPVPTSWQESNGTPNEGVRPFVQTALDAFIDKFDGINPTNPAAFGIYSPTDGVIRDIVSATVPNYFGHLRTRRS